MAVTANNMTARPVNETDHNCATSSIGAIPVAASVVITNAGYVQRVMAAAAGTTTGTVTIAVTQNSSATDICNGLFLLAPGSNARSGSVFEFQNGVGVGGATSPVFANEGDIFTFTPSGGGGSNIAGGFGLVVRQI